MYHSSLITSSSSSLYISRLTEQAKTNLMNSEKFENISQDVVRVDDLVKQYDDLYSQLRLEALDDLDNIKSFDDLERSDEIKSQITFAIITVRHCFVKSFNFLFIIRLGLF